MAFMFRPLFALAILMVVLQSASVNARIVHRIRDFDVFVPEQVTRCRMNCLVEFVNKDDNVKVEHDPCTDRPDCFMCWDFCRILHTEKPAFGKSICNDSGICFDGCKFACSYYKLFTWEKLNSVN